MPIDLSPELQAELDAIAAEVAAQKKAEACAEAMAARDWYLTGVHTGPEGYVNAAGSDGLPVDIPGMQVLIGRDEDHPVEAIVGLLKGTPVPAGWTQVLDLHAEHDRLFGVWT